MNSEKAVRALGALAQETRLSIFRRLVAAGPEGLAAGVLSALLDVPAPTLSFHLKELEAAGLVSGRRDGRHIYYAADFDKMRGLLIFLTEDCCGGRAEICGGLPSCQ